jgi:hypothetical protein
LAYLTCIGSDGANRNNDCGHGSRGYWIRRRGSVVFLTWGPVEMVKDGHGYRVFWLSLGQHRPLRCGTVTRAKKTIKERIASLTGNALKYCRMKPGNRIFPKRQSVK